MGSYRILKVLMWKHYLTRKRNLVSTIIELVTSALFFPILFTLRTQNVIKSLSATNGMFEDLKDLETAAAIGLKSFGLWNYDTTHSPIPDDLSLPPSINGRKSEPISLTDVVVPSIVLYSPVTPYTQLLMDKVGEQLHLPELTELPDPTARGYYGFSNEKSIEHFVEQMDNRHAIVIFENIKKTPRQLNYTIRTKLSKSDYTTHIASLGDRGKQYGTTDEPFLRLQWAIDCSFLYLLTGQEINPTVTLQEFPYAQELPEQSPMNVVIFAIEYCWMSIYMAYLQLLTRLVTERTSGVQILLQMSGVSKNMSALSHFLNVLPMGLLFSVTGAVFLKLSSKPLIPMSNGFLIFIILFLYFSAVMALGFVISFIPMPATYADAVAAVIFVAFSLLCTNIRNPKVPVVAQHLFGILPNMPMLWFWSEVGVLEIADMGLTFSTVASSHSRHGLSALGCYALLLAQSAFMFLLTWYLSYVHPGKYGVAEPWNFLWKKKVAPATVSMSEEESLVHDKLYFEDLPPNADVGIRIMKVTKIYGKEFALSNVSFDVLRGEITVLLGHNGAGKTTLMSIITGSFSPTSGFVLVGGKPAAQAIAHGQVGLCPQHNIFFSNLTVLEHIIFFSMLKGQTRSQARNSSTDLLRQLNMADKANAQSDQLSGGMKRRLQLACALVGSTEVLVLDEPTSGLDVETRRELWDLLLSLRGSRTILLSTHFMEEADALGDRVVAMHAGRLRCHATPLYLKKNIGTGYRLSLTTIGLPKEAAIMAVVTSHIPEAILKEVSLNSIAINLPADSSGKFSALFAMLEQQRSELSIESIGLGMSTLEEVFLKLGSNVDTTFTEEVTAEPVYTRLTGGRLFVRQMIILMKRHVQFVLARKWSFLVFNVLVLASLVLIITFATDLKPIARNSTAPKPLDLDLYRGMPDRRVFYRVSDARPLRTLAVTYPDVEFQVTDDVDGAILRASKEDIPEYNKYLAGIELNNTHAKVLYTARLRHAAPVALNLLSNMLAARLGPVADERAITTNSFPLQEVYVSLQNKAYLEPQSILSYVGWTTGVVFYLTIFIPLAVSLPCAERLSGARHLHMMAGCAASTHWAATLLFHTVLYTLLQGSIVLVIVAAVVRDGVIDRPAFLGVLFLSLLLGNAAYLSMTYLVSFYMSELNAITVLITVSLVLGIVPALISTVTEENKTDLGVFKTVLQVPLYLHPVGTLLTAFIDATRVARGNAICNLNKHHCPVLTLKPEGIKKCCTNNENPMCYYCFEKHAPAKDWLILIFQMIAYMILVLCAQHGLFNWLWDRCRNKGYKPPYSSSPDEFVQAEATYVSKAITLPHKDVPDVMLVNDIHKQYAPVCKKKFNAVKGIIFSVKKGECFGVLGVNGAGKSTTFKMITAEESITRGSVLANGHMLKFPRTTYLQSLGYCPQFSGLNEYMTGRQNLTLLLTLRGVPPSHLAELVNSWIAVVGLEKYADLAVAGYSGGCKRRMATAAALCSGAPLALLDEPTAGVDVAARRRVWAAMRRGLAAGRAIIITSHSMDEMEALCVRIAIISGGRVAALGPAPALRARHAQGHAVMLKLKSKAVGDESDGAGGASAVQNLKDRMQQKFNCTLKDEHKTMLHYHINETLQYSDLFRDFEQLKQDFSHLIEDYSITETTLEEVFLSFAHQPKPEAEPGAAKTKAASTKAAKTKAAKTGASKPAALV